MPGLPMTAEGLFSRSRILDKPPRWPAVESFCSANPLGLLGQDNCEGRPLAEFRGDRNVAAVARDEVPADREAEAGSLSLFLRRVEGLEESLLHLGRDPRPGVGDRDGHK